MHKAEHKDTSALVITCLAEAKAQLQYIAWYVVDSVYIMMMCCLSIRHCFHFLTITFVVEVLSLCGWLKTLQTKRWLRGFSGETLSTVEARLHCTGLGINEGSVYWHAISVIIQTEPKCILITASITFPNDHLHSLASFSLYRLLLPERRLPTWMRNKYPANTAVALAKCQTYTAHLTCIKYALPLKYTDEVNPGKSHYPLYDLPY